MQIVVFDLDNTLVKKNISFQFFYYLFLRRKISFLKLLYPLCKYVKYRLNFLSINAMHQLVFEGFLKNKNTNLFNENVKSFLDKKLNKLLNPVIYDYLQKHLTDRNYVILMSSSPSFLVSEIAKRLKINNCFSTEYDQLDGKIFAVRYFLSGDMKKKILQDFLKKNQISFDKIIAFSDSIDDLPLLKICDQVYLVKPSQKLKKNLDQSVCQII